MMCHLFEGATKPLPHRIVSNGVGAAFRPLPEQKPEEYRDQFVILFTGRYSKEKSHRVLIDGVNRSKYCNRIQLIFAGAGPLEYKLKKYADEHLPVKPVFGFFPREQMRRIAGYADLYVHPARYEAEGIACLEAMACGKVILSSDSRKSATRGFALTENNLFHYNDPISLAEKIDYWIEHTKARTLCGEVYAQYASRFEFEKCMDQMEEMFNDAAGTKSDLLLSDDGGFCGDEYHDADSGCDLPVHS
jgi:glycosyltransferase involved in cell wall biosynthesis